MREYSLAIGSGLIVTIILTYITPASNIDPTSISSIVSQWWLSLVFLLVSGIVYWKNAEIISHINMYKSGRMRGLWRDSYLDSLIKKQFSKSKKIKIKVTRSYNLFINEGNNNFRLCLSGNPKEEKNIQLLMHYPCILNSHNKNRAQIHKKSGKDFLASWFEVLKKLGEVNDNSDNGLTINIRFYGGLHETWRYYIFEDGKEALLLSYYDKHSPGSQVPMFKILRGASSLLSSMSRHFDGIWNHDSIDAYNFVVNLFGTKNNNLSKCGECEQQGICKPMAKEYLREMEHLSAVKNAQEPKSI